jgi:hypothetical protein
LDQVAQAGLVQFLGRPFIEMLQSGPDDAVVEQPSDAVFVGEVGLEVAFQRVAMGENPLEREEGSGQSEPGIAEQTPQGSEAPE